MVLLNNIPSHKMGKKDMLKIETDLDLDMDVLGLIDPNVTVNIVRNGELVEKISLTLPKEVDGIMTCKNPRCITQYENVGKIRFSRQNPIVSSSRILRRLYHVHRKGVSHENAH